MTLSRLFSAVAATLCLATLASAAEALPKAAKLTKIEATPASVKLATPFEYAQLVLTGTLQNGDRIDVTRMVAFTTPDSVKVSETGQVRPKADGKGNLVASLDGQKLEIPVEVTGQKDKVEVSYVRDVMPLLARMGCNAGTCHGAESGKGGFKLSLRGYDPLFDHRALTDDLAGRRFNRAAPDQSLMLMKPSGAVPHVGGVLTSSGEPYYETLKAWIGDGVKADLDGARVKSIEVVPSSATIQLFKQKQQLAVIATFTDGKKRDVTAEAFLDSSNTEVATVDRAATVTAVRRGETTIMARYEGAYSATTIIVMGDRSGFAWKKVDEYNWIDTLVYEKLQLVKVLPSDVCTDGEFIRRIYIDLTGVPPQPEEVRAFITDNTPSKEKREKLIDKLIGSDEFVEHWTNKWADLLQVNTKFLGNEGATAFRGWIKKAVASNMPYDKFTYEILTGSGSNVQTPQASYYKVLRTPDAVMENTTQLFLGVRFNCNKCHDHPFERWTQNQYYELSAYFAQVGRKEAPENKGRRIGGSAVEGALPVVEVIEDLKGGEITHVRTGQVAKTVFPYSHKDLAPSTATRRVQVAKWLTSKENQYFAKSYVNRLWAYMLGTGLIEPIDDIRAGNPPTNPKLLDRLTEEFVKSGFDVRHVMKLITKSRTYQHSVATNRWNEDDVVNYSRATARRLSAEVLYDTIHRATGSASKLPQGVRAAALLDRARDAEDEFLSLFGKPPRESACECERSGGMQLGPVLNLVNGPVVAEAIRDPNNRLAKLLRTEKDTKKVVEELYLAFLCRLPTEREMAVSLKAIEEGEEDYNDALVEAKKRQDAIAAYEKTIPQKQAQWEAQQNVKPEWKGVEIVSMTAKSGATLAKQADGSILVTGKNANQELYTIVVTTPLTNVTAIRLEVLPDDKLPNKGPGRADNGNFVLNEFKVSAVELGKKDKPTPFALQRPESTFDQPGLPIANVIDNNPATGWAIFGAQGRATEAKLELQKPIAFAKGAQLTITMDQRFGQKHTLGKFRIMVSDTKGPLSLKGPPPQISAILAIPADKRSPEQKAVLTAAYRAQDVELGRLVAEAAKHAPPVDKRHPGVQDLAWVLINTKAFQFNH